MLGEPKKVAKEMITSWEKNILPTTLFRYQLHDIYKVDEFNLFCEALPSKTLHFKGQHCSGGKHNKKRIIGMAAYNAL